MKAQFETTELSDQQVHDLLRFLWETRNLFKLQAAKKRGQRVEFLCILPAVECEALADRAEALHTLIEDGQGVTIQGAEEL